MQIAITLKSGKVIKKRLPFNSYLLAILLIIWVNFKYRKDN